MGAFEEIVASYEANHDGTWISGPCGVCGSQVYFFPDDTPECLPCFREREQVEVVSDAAVQFDIALNLLGEVVRSTTGEEARRLLHERLGLWGLTLALWEART